ncbi:hypothetical protein BD311DRAFT_752284 [Dichomitus squalens]|uniref:Uncharacterized protein n=1 Tax=Dichomitus squalens TaxID=114155 RepID=A0A4Q9MWK5_9APHY|nr:hypothetical protein BD311DRAFT_752284 [Dichomitus squalens]
MSLAPSSSLGASFHVSQTYSYTPMIPRTQFSEAFTGAQMGETRLGPRGRDSAATFSLSDLVRLLG